MIRYLAFLSVFISVSCGAELRSPISIINLISTPDNFDGQVVRVIGYGVFDEHSTIICLNKDDIEFGMLKNCVWLGIAEKINKEARDLSNSYVDIEGVFVKNRPNHTYIASGIVKNVQSIYSSVPKGKSTGP